MWKKEHEEIVGKSIKEIEQTFAKSVELRRAQRRNLIMGASMAVLLVLFVAMTFADRADRANISSAPPTDRTSGDVNSLFPGLFGQNKDSQEGMLPFDPSEEVIFDVGFDDPVDGAENQENQGLPAEGTEGEPADQPNNPVEVVDEGLGGDPYHETGEGEDADLHVGASDGGGADADVHQPEAYVDGEQHGDDEIPIAVIVRYQVRMGETLAVVSYKHYNTATYASHIARYNGLAGDDQLIGGRLLYLPNDPARFAYE